MAQVDIFLAIPATFGAVLLLSVLLFQISFVYYGVDPGPISRVQFYSCLSASIAVIGHLVNAFGLYSFSDNVVQPGSFCLVEAVSSCFGELALVLWQICSAVTVLLALRPEVWNAPRTQTIAFSIFHAFVWIPSLVTTVIPWSQGLLGINYSPQDPSNFWCWFKVGNGWWEDAQFYFPLYICMALCAGVFAYTVYRVRQISAASQAESSIFFRLALQLFVLTLIFLPDSIAAHVSRQNALFSPTAYQVTTIVWKCESWLVALMWLTNVRVQDCIKKLPFILSLRSWFGATLSEKEAAILVNPAASPHSTRSSRQSSSMNGSLSLSSSIGNSPSTAARRSQQARSEHSLQNRLSSIDSTAFASTLQPRMATNSVPASPSLGQQQQQQMQLHRSSLHLSQQHQIESSSADVMLETPSESVAEPDRELMQDAAHSKPIAVMTRSDSQDTDCSNFDYVDIDGKSDHLQHLRQSSQDSQPELHHQLSQSLLEQLDMPVNISAV